MDLLWLDEPSSQNLNLVGGKVANLSHLATRYRVPPGFCLTTTAFTKWAMLDPAAIVPPELQHLLGLAYQTLAERCNMAEPRVAVRSSAVDEDGAGTSFAGQYETYLNIAGLEAILEAVRRCWASARSERVIAYRRQRGLPLDGIKLAVLVQQLVMADISMVVFSANPVSGSRAEVVINASWGLGESIVSGRVTPDTYLVRKADLTITSRQIARKQQMTVAAPGGTKEVGVPRLLSTQPTLTDEQAIEVARLALMLEEQMGWPVDLECAYQAGELYLLQCRSITTLT